MNSINLLKLKNDNNCISLNNTIITSILELFNQSNIKTVKVSATQINILQNNKIQGKKELNENKIIMIMNKISQNNINELVIEYLLLINITTVEEYNIIQREMLCKLVKDIKFIDNYIQFIIKIFSIEKYRLSLEPLFFISTLNKQIIDNYTTDTLETDRISYLQIVKKLIAVTFFTSDLNDYISNLILSQNIYKIDVYYWFNNKDLLNKYETNIRDTINYCTQNNLKREALMIESLFENIKLPVIYHEIKEIVKVDNKNEFIILVNNIIDEYLYLECIDEVTKFINNSCKELIEKNIFCQELLKYYFLQSDKKITILNLYDSLIKNKIIYKSNISKGLLLYIENNNISKQDNIEVLLHFLKNNNITKNIEHIFKKYHIKINYNIP